MSKDLSQLLGKSREEIARFIAGVEEMCGYPSEDVRLVSETKARAASQLSRLGLDPSDTTGRELSAALKLRFKNDSSHFSQALGLNASTAVDKRNRLVADIVCGFSGETWALRKHVAKDLLLSSPPKKVMKALGYRSVLSLLKREDMNEVYAAISVLESVRWQQSFWKKHTKLTPSDFEIRPVELHVMSTERWVSLSGNAGLVTCVLPLGSAVVWPASEKFISAASLAVLLFEGVEHLKIYSCALKMEQMDSSFGQKVVELMRHDLLSPVSIGGSYLEWGVLHRHYGCSDPGRLPAYFDPHLSPEDFHTKTVSQQMARLHPAFSWWADNDSTAYLAGSSFTSMNLDDMVASILGKRDAAYGLGKSLWSELIGRYMAHASVEKHVLFQLDNAGQGKETISIRASNKNLTPQTILQAEFA